MKSSYTDTISSLGIYSALLSVDHAELLELRECDDADVARKYALNTLYPRLFEKNSVLELGAYYDPIRRCLENDSGPLKSNTYALHNCILGENELFSDPYFSAWCSPNRIVGKIAEGLGKVDLSDLRLQYDLILSIDPQAVIRTPYGPEIVFGDEDFENTWRYFTQLQPFFENANDFDHEVVFVLHGDV